MKNQSPRVRRSGGGPLRAAAQGRGISDSREWRGARDIGFWEWRGAWDMVALATLKRRRICNNIKKSIIF